MTARITLFTLALIVCARMVAAQTVTLVPANPTVWDTNLTIGWMSGDKHELGESWNDWYDTFATSLEVGRYWTPHIKTELGTTFTSDGTVYSQEQIISAGRTIFLSREHAFSVRAVNASATYQFLENTWAHPFLTAGVHAAWERERVEREFSSGPPGGPLPAVEPRRTTFDAKPFVSGGAKFYITERGFIRTDLSSAFDTHGVARVWWRIGAGVDF